MHDCARREQQADNSCRARRARLRRGTCQILPHTLGYTHSFGVTHSGQAFFVRVVIFAIRAAARGCIDERRSACAGGASCTLVDSAHMSTSVRAAICAMEFRVPQRKHEGMEHQASSTTDAYDSRRVSTDALRDVHRGAVTQHLCGDRSSRVGVGRRGAVDPGPWSTPLRKDIVPGHPQYPPVRRGCRLHLHQARRDGGDGDLAAGGRVDVSLRPERRGGVSTWGRTGRLVASDHGSTVGYGRRDGRGHGLRQPDARRARWRTNTGPNEPERCSRHCSMRRHSTTVAWARS